MLLYFLVEKYSTYHLLRNTKKETDDLYKILFLSYIVVRYIRARLFLSTVSECITRDFMNVVSVHFFFLHVHVPMLCEMSASAVEVEK